MEVATRFTRWYLVSVLTDPMIARPLKGVLVVEQARLFPGAAGNALVRLAALRAQRWAASRWAALGCCLDSPCLLESARTACASFHSRYDAGMTPEEAPITAMMLTVQFAPPLPSLNLPQLVDAYNPFRQEFPGFDQLPPAGPMPLNMSMQNVFFPPTPRSRFLTADERYHILFQNDRFSFAWNRLSPLSQPPEYPGFVAVLEGNANALNATWTEPAALSGFTQTSIVGPITTGHQEQAMQLQVTSRFPVAQGWGGLGEAFNASHTGLLTSFRRLITPAFRPI